jgi:hypothetical protein
VSAAFASKAARSFKRQISKNTVKVAFFIIIKINVITLFLGILNMDIPVGE